MSSLQKIFISFLIITSFMFNTSLAEGKEEPKDAINAIITAIENSDGETFMEYVPKEYWVTLAKTYKDFKDDNILAWFKSISQQSDFAKQMRNTNLRHTDDHATELRSRG